MRRLYFIKNKEKIYIALIVSFVLLLGFGYAFLNSRLSMQGKIAVRVKEDIRVTNYYLKSTINGAKEINSEYKKKSVMTNISLPNIDSTIAYQGEITNIGTFAMVLDSINNLVGDNENIVYDISLKVGDLFYGNGEKYTFTVTFKYKEGLTEVPENTELNSTIGFEFKKKESVLAKGSSSTTVIFNKQLEKSKIESIEFLDYIEPSYEVVDKWDASDKKDGSVMAWTVLDEDTKLYKLYIGGINGVVANTDSSYAFYNFSKANSIVFNDNYDTKYATNMRSMFSGCSKVEVLNLSCFNTENVTTMSNMFGYCTNLLDLDLSSFDTSNVVNMSSMFARSAIEKLDLSSFDTSKVKDMSNMFSSGDWTASTKIGNIVFGEKFNTSNVTTMSKMFYHCTELTKLDLSNFNTSNVTTMASMFDGCTNLEELDLSSFNTSKVTNMSSMFGSSDMNHTSGMKKINLSSFDTSNVTNMNQMFWRCSNLIELDLSNFNTSKITNMSYLFANCPKLTSINLSSFDTSNVTNMSYMFYGDYSILELNLSNFNTSNVTNMSFMFSSGNWTTKMVIKNINLSNFNTSNVTNMEKMFYNCTELTKLDLSNFNTSNVTNMSSMFDDCISLEELDLSSFNTSKVTNMSFMFGASNINYTSGIKKINLSSFDTSNVTNMSSMFSRCSSLTELDLSNFDTSSVTNMTTMFHMCTKLSNLDIKKFTFDKVTSSTNMFYGVKSGINITVGSDTAKEFVSKLNTTATITVA